MQNPTLNSEFPHRQHIRNLVETDRRFRGLEARFHHIASHCDSLEKEMENAMKRWQDFPKVR